MVIFSDIKDFLKNLRKFTRDERFAQVQKEFGLSKFRLVFSYIVSRVFLKFAINEFFNYNLFFLNFPGMRQYLNTRYNKYLNKKFNYRPQLKIIAEKEEMMYAFRDFIKRDFCGDVHNGTEEGYKKFSENHEKKVHTKTKTRFWRRGRKNNINKGRPEWGVFI